MFVAGHPGDIPSIAHLPTITAYNQGTSYASSVGHTKVFVAHYTGTAAADPDNLRDKGKSKAQEPEVPSGNGNIDEGSDLVQFCLMMVHCFCIKLENHSLHDIERQVGHKVWIISGPKKGYRGMLQSVSRTYCNVVIESGIMQLKNTAVITEFGMCLNGAILDSTQMVAFIELCQKSFVWTAPRSATPLMLTVDPSAEPGPSTLACNPWVSHPDDITPWPLNELAQANVDYGT
ncbi:hypothetical protein EDC04DRAFT_2606469 [Pisolithus marmoratus]|nr:hypothetical protein EDC04DRAFT_2606469 [Pisolithus marmoratus]